MISREDRGSVHDLAGKLAVLLLATTLLASAVVADPRRASGVPAVRVDGIVAIVGATTPGPNADVVLRSDVDLRARMLIAGRTEGALSLAPIPEDLWRAVLDEVIGEVLIAREAARVGVASPSDAVVARELVRLAGEAGGAERLSALLDLLGADREELAVFAQRRAVVVAFLEANLAGATRITDAELARAYALGNHPFTDRSLEDAQGALRAWLAQQEVERAVHRWVTVLRARVPVYVPSPRSPAGHGTR